MITIAGKFFVSYFFDYFYRMVNLSRSKRYLLSILSGILMIISFPYTGSLTPMVFFAWIPLLFVEDNITRKNYRSSKVYVHALITFFLYNIGTTWWVSNADLNGSIMAIGLNSLFMALVFYLFHRFRKNLEGKVSLILLPVFWIAFEYTHYHWELSWPWLQFGNVFSITPSFVQWYSFTGVFGGSLWVFLVNIFVFVILRNKLIKGERWTDQKKSIAIFFSALFIPLIVSLSMYFSYEEKIDPVEIVVVQPNIDPYNEKFETDLKRQLDKIYALIDEKVDKETDFIIAPETAISASFFEDDLQTLPFYQYTLKRKENWYKAAFLTGASTSKFYPEKNSISSRKIDGGPGYYENYNTSLLVNEFNEVTFVHKSKLVLGVEKLPFTSIFPSIEELSIDLGGSSGSLGVEKEPKIMQANKVTFAPSICYESIYGEFITQQVKKGASIIYVITNDGWWEDTPGYKQHASFSRLRAIENRRSVARSANTGISCFINQRGDVIKQSNWWVPAVMKQSLNKNSDGTVYSSVGDIIGKLAAFLSVLLIMYFTGRKIQRLFL